MASEVEHISSGQFPAHRALRCLTSNELNHVEPVSFLEDSRNVFAFCLCAR